MEFETFEIPVHRSSGVDRLTDDDREQALAAAASVANEAVAHLLGRLANRVLGRPDVTDDGWLEWSRAEAALPQRERDRHQAEWHLVKMQIERRLGLDHTGNVLNARRYGASWQAIAVACGITRQAAHDRWSAAAETFLEDTESTEPTHQITELRSDDDAGDAIWRCQCGDDADGYASLDEARYAAAEHQLPAAIQREIADAGYSIEQWRDAVLVEADAAADQDPAAWRWYRETAPA